ncbi:hypothetical protein RI367_005019 [Sorochytrium milnesiophthora]
MADSSSSLSKQLARLPQELVDIIVVFAGPEACVATRNPTLLRQLLAGYKTSSNYSTAYERRLLTALLDDGWSDGLRMFIDLDVRDELNVALKQWCWDKVTLPVASLKKLGLQGRVECAVLTYNLWASGATGDDVSEWLSRHAQILGAQLIKHGASLQRLRNVCQQTGFYIDDCHLAKTFLPDAARHSRIDLVRQFDSICPEILQEHDSALEAAGSGGSLDVVQFICTKRLLQPLLRIVFDSACMSGHETVARWLNERTPMAIDCMQALHLVRGNCVDLLQWHAHNAIDALSLEALQWYFDQGMERNSKRLLCMAAAAGRTDVVVEWMSNTMPECYTAQAVAKALGAGHLELAQWMATKFATPLSDCRPSPDELYGMVINGRLDVIQWIDRHCGGIACNERLFSAAVQSRNLGIVQLLHLRHPSVVLTSNMMEEACKGGNLALLQWTYGRIAPADRSVHSFHRAAAYGHLSLLQWLFSSTELVCPHYAINGAVDKGLLEIVRFLRDNGIERCSREALSRAATRGHIEMVDLLYDSHRELFDSHTMRLKLAFAPL